MTGILLAIIAGGVMSAAFFYVAEKIYSDGLVTFMTLFGFLLGAASFLGFVAYMVLSFEWFAAEHQAKIINREYGTNYTQEEVFYASNVIDTVRELDRKRIELNGDLLKEKK